MKNILDGVLKGQSPLYEKYLKRGFKGVEPLT
jgi:hypothetical protein